MLDDITVDAISQGSSDEYMRLGRPRPLLDYSHRELVNTVVHGGVDKIALLRRAHVGRLSR